MIKLMPELDPFSRIFCCVPGLLFTIKLMYLIKYPFRLPQIHVFRHYGVASQNLEYTSLYWKLRSCP